MSKHVDLDWIYHAGSTGTLAICSPTTTEIEPVKAGRTVKSFKNN
jgi:hypothetical protein